MNQINLAQIGYRLFFCACLSILVSSCFSSKPELHLFTWVNYIKPSLIEAFEKEYKCRVVINTFDSNESMYTKLKLGATGYDILFPSNYYADLMQQQNMLEPINHSRLPNIKFVDQNYQNMLDAYSDTFGVPYMVTWTGIGYRKDKIDIDQPSWDIFDRASLKGRLTMLNDPREALGAALKYLGYSLNTINENEINQAETVLIKWKKNLAKFESEQFKSGLASAEYLAVQGFVGEILLVAEENPNVGCVLPEEGTIFSIDLMTISKDSENKELAYAFINYLLEPKVAAENMVFTQILLANSGAYDKLPEKMKESSLLFPHPSITGKSELIKYLGKDNQLYHQAWDRVKAAE